MWSTIQKAKSDSVESEEALKILVQRYRKPIQAQVAKYFKNEAEDLTQEFIATIFVRDLVPNADPSRGRFRGFLAKRLHWFLMDRLRKRYTQKQGRAQQPVSLDALNPETLVHAADSGEFYREMDRELARAVFVRAFTKAREQCAKRGDAKAFDLLIGKGARRPIREIAEELGISEAAARVKRHRLGKLVKDCFVKEVSDLVSPEELEDEVQYLLSLAQGSLSDQA